MIELDIPLHLGRLTSITPELAREFRFPALFSFANADADEVGAAISRGWDDERNSEPYRLLCLRSLRYLTVRATLLRQATDFTFWSRVYAECSDAESRLECILACYGSEDERAWDLVRAAASDPLGKIRVFALQVAGTMVRQVPARRAAGMALLKYHLDHGNPWNRLGGLMGFSIAGLRGDGLIAQIVRFIDAEWDDTLRHMAIGLLARVMDKDAFAGFAAAFATRAAPLPASTEAVLFAFLSQVHPARAQVIAAQAIADPKAAGPLAGAAAQGLAVHSVLGARGWADAFRQALGGVQ